MLNPLSRDPRKDKPLIKKSGGNKFWLVCVLILSNSCCVVSSSTYAQSAGKTDNENAISQEKDDSNKKVSDTSANFEKKPEIDWGDWNTELTTPIPNKKFGVGIKGKLEAELSTLDKSNLLENPTGVSAKEKAKGTGKGKIQTDLKKTMAELEALEAKVKKEIEDDSEF